ncbi:hypothetical protein NHX12_012880 [Muraenolepis orangiensis]|uniref:Uncharacterized protein n=1 Tax=Muraenolepis orangiensis TaxID=630683 RepID=A0A9Q0I4F6_9TELE|nr:hypothetical protein NHX12_012880 [Muraenolepis orangiensis]
MDTANATALQTYSRASLWERYGEHCSLQQQQQQPLMFHLAHYHRRLPAKTLSEDPLDSSSPMPMLSMRRRASLVRHPPAVVMIAHGAVVTV